MFNTSAPWARGLAIVALVSLVASCGLPRSGPNKREIFAGSERAAGDAFIVEVDDRVNRATAITPALGFSRGFLNAGRLATDTINPGDILGLTVWENVDDGLLVNLGQNATPLEEVQVDSAGFVFVPYAGRIKAAGNSPEALRRIITERLEAQTPDPQVEVRRLAGDGSTVSVVGGITAQGVYPIERSTRTLAAMLARAGGIAIEPEIARISVVRGKHVGEIWFEDLYDDPRLDIALRAGDRILVEEDTRSYTAVGATGTQTRINFQSQQLSAIEAIATVGGLNPNSADPTGVFVFRNEADLISNQVLGRNDLIGAQRLVYVLNLTEPNGLFLARDFLIRDGDTVYVTEAPYTQFAKALGAITGVLTPAASISQLTNN